jgi:hypothetical protein
MDEPKEGFDVDAAWSWMIAEAVLKISDYE